MSRSSSRGGRNPRHPSRHPNWYQPHEHQLSTQQPHHPQDDCSQYREQQQSYSQYVPEYDNYHYTNNYRYNDNPSGVSGYSHQEIDHSSHRGEYGRQFRGNQCNTGGQNQHHNINNETPRNLSQTNQKKTNRQTSEENAKLLDCEFDERIFNRHFELSSFYRPMDASEESMLIRDLFTTESWSTNILTNLKNRLNEIRIPYYANVSEEWHDFRDRIRTTTRIKPKLISEYDVEMCTNSWLKITELFYKYSEFLIPSNLTGKPVPVFRTLHLCEAPGSFICATNHYIRQKYNSRIDWNWTAMTFNPYNESIAVDTASVDDRFLIETIKHWYFGVDNTGDILNANNIEGLWRKYQNENDKVHLVTADGSFETIDKTLQEENIGPLLYAEVLAALGALHNKGSFVMQVFSMFECHTVCLFYLLAICFDSIFVTKPAASHADNAEKYVICKGFRGMSDKILNELLRHVNTQSKKAMFPQSFIPESFLEEMSECSGFFVTRHIEATQRNQNLQKYSKNGNIVSPDLKQRLNALKEQVTEKYIKSNPISRIDKKYRIVQAVHLTGSLTEPGNSLFVWQKMCQGKYPLLPRSLSFSIDQTTGVPIVEGDPFFDTIDSSPESINFNQNSIVTARKLTRISTSIFARTDLMEELYKLRSEVYQKNKIRLIFQINSKQLFLSECYTELGSMNFYYSHTAIELQSVDRYLNVVNSFRPLSATDPLLFVILPSPSDSAENLGYAEYIAWQQSGLAHGLVFTTVDNTSQFKTPCSTIRCCHPEENVEEIFKNEFTTPEQSRIHLVIGDVCVQYDDLMKTTLTEELYKYELTQTCRDALNLLSCHGHFICKISDMFTRFTIGLIYILYMSFENITILKPFTLNPALPDRFLVCQNYLGRNNLYIEHLNCCLDRMTKLQNTENQIVQIVPVVCFKNSAFINYIREQTQYLMKRECEALKKLLWFIETKSTANIIDRVDGAAQRIKTFQRVIENIQ